jgi:hypothetical protein
VLIDYLTGAALLLTGASVLVPRKTRTAAACLGWLLLTLLIIYLPLMIGALSNSNIEVQVEGINYFADTLLFTGVILALAGAARRANIVASLGEKRTAKIGN